MPKQKSPASQSANRAKPVIPYSATSFLQTLEEALKNFNDPGWLGECSPLAAPYLLSLFLRPKVTVDLTNPLARGKALQQILQSLVQSLPTANEIEQRERKILELRYLSAKPKRVSGQRGLLELLNITANTYNLSKNAAIERLAKAFTLDLQPTLRLDRVALPNQLWARESELAFCLQVLSQRKSLSLVGEGGVGKTAFASTLAHHFAANSVFWVTIRPGLNDRLNSLFFALAHFLHQHNLPELLAQLVADGGEIKNQQLIFDLLQSGLEQLANQAYVLCFDELELLKPEEMQSHKEIVTLLENLALLVPVIFIGQRRLVSSQEICQLAGFSLDHVQEFLQQAQIELSTAAVTVVHAYTNGNPRLLELFIALYQSLVRQNSSVEAIFAELAQHSSVDSLLRRIRRHLTKTELQILQQLSVFRHAAPLEVWTEPAAQQAMQQLIAWRLVKPDQSGGISLLPAYQSAVYEQLTSKEKELLHLHAAAIRTQRGQFAAAAYHYWAGGEPEIALSLWNQYHEAEINQGQATAALALLQAISDRQLSLLAREILQWRRAELHKLLGNYDDALQSLEEATWNSPVQVARAQRLRGDIAELRGNAQQALAAYQAAQNTLEQSSMEAANLHRALGYLALHERNYVAAQHEVSRIRHEAANLEGFIYERSGDLQAAQLAYLDAIRLAEQAHYPYGKANAHMNLGCVFVWKRDLAQAQEHLLAAIAYFEHCNMANKQGEAISNLALAYLQAQDYRAAIQAAQLSRAIFEQLHVKRGEAAAHQLLAEAHFALRELPTAESHVQQVLAGQDPTIQPDGLRLLGEIRIQQGALEEAETLIGESLALVRDKPYKILEGYSWRALGKVYLAQKNYQQAQAALQQAYQIFVETGLPEEMAETKALFVSDPAI